VNALLPGRGPAGGLLKFRTGVVERVGIFVAACSFVVRGVRVKVLRAALLASSALMVAQTAAHADDFRGIGTLGGSDSFILGLSADGAFAVGQSQTTGNAAFHATRWSGGVLSDLGTLGGTNSVASGVSADGAVVVGSSFLANNITQRAFRWTGGVMTDIGTLGGGGSLAFGVSADGAVVVGQSDILGGGTFHAFRWSGGIMSDIGTLGGSASHAGGVSADGTVLVGWASTPGDVAQHAFRWTGGIMSDLGTLGGASFAEGVSADGAVVIGTSFLAGNVVQRAFRWSGGTMTDLGTLAGGTNSRAFAVSADGSVVVGQSESTAVPNVGEAFRWKATTGMKSVRDLLAASGVNMTGWTLDLAIGVSADGTVIAGQGTQSGHREGWIARFGSFGNGLITTGVVAQSFSGQAAIGQTGNAAIGNALGTFTEYATQAGNSKGAGNSAFQAFGYAGYDSDPAASGTLA
jgi:probable HAF family extracellular repeat protein